MRKISIITLLTLITLLGNLFFPFVCFAGNFKYDILNYESVENVDLYSNLGTISLLKNKNKKEIPIFSLYAGAESDECFYNITENSLGVSETISWINTDEVPYNTLEKQYPLNSISVNDVAVSKNGLIFVATNFLYYSGQSDSGLEVIDNKMTVSPDDDEFVFSFNSRSSPINIGSDIVFSVEYIDDENLLVFSTVTGLYFVDTLGDKDFSNDILLKRYYSGSTPSLANDSINNFWFNDNKTQIFVSDGTLLDLNGTLKNFDDDFILTFYYYLDVFTLLSDFIGAYHEIDFVEGTSIINFSGSNLFLSLDHKNTYSVLDDEIIIYYPASFFGFDHNAGIQFYTFEQSSDGNLFFIGTNKGLFVVNRNNTFNDYTDDYIDYSYSINSNPALSSNKIYDIQIIGNEIYIGSAGFSDWSYSSIGSLQVFKLGDLYTISDDVEVEKYDSTTLSTFPADTVNKFLIYNDYIYIAGTMETGTSSSYGGLITIYKKNDTCTVNIPPKMIDNNIEGLISWMYENGTENKIKIERSITSDADKIFFDDFNDGILPDIVINLNGWGEFFHQYEEKGSILKFWQPNYDKWTMWNINFPRLTPFATGSEATIRTRINKTDNSYFAGFFFFGSWDSNWGYYNALNRWTTLKFKSLKPFNMVSSELQLEPITNSSWDMNKDSVEIDWILIEEPSIVWSNWEEICTNIYSCKIPPVPDGYISKYKITIEKKQNENVLIKNVSFANGYADSGYYQSSIIDAGTMVNWNEITYDSSIPAGTSVKIKARTGNTTDFSNWSDWQEVNSPIQSPNARYLQFRIEFMTNNPDISASVSNINVYYSYPILAKTGNFIFRSVILLILSSIFTLILILGKLKAGKINQIRKT